MMLRILPLSRTIQRSPLSAARGLVSSALLTKSSENESRSIAELRAEAKRRGLSAKGTKVAIASRIDEHDKSMSTTPSSASSKSSAVMGARGEKTMFATRNMAGTREASSLSSPPLSSAANTTEAPGNPEPPVVPVAPYRLNIHLPDLSQRAPLPPVDPPYVPDFWDSSAPFIPPVEEDLPKLVVVGGAATHHGGGPTHSSMDPRATEDSSLTSKRSYTNSFLDDIAEDCGLPPITDKLRRGFSSLFN